MNAVIGGVAMQPKESGSKPSDDKGEQDLASCKLEIAELKELVIRLTKIVVKNVLDDFPGSKKKG